MRRNILIVGGALIGWIVLALLGYGVSLLGEWAFGTRATMISASILATLAVVMLLGQYLAGTSDYFLSIDNPRPLDEEEDVITSKIWGFASQASRTYIPGLTGQGFADIRLFAARRQVLASFATFGFSRPVTVAWRGNAGQHPLGEA